MALDSNALVTLADAKDYLQIVSVDHDTILEMLINSISTRFESRCRRSFNETTDATLYLDGNGEKELTLPRSPVASIATVTEDDTALTAGEDEDYYLYSRNNDAYLYRIGTTWLEGRKNIILTDFKAGFTTIPKDIQLACFKQVAFEFQKHQKREWGETSRSFGDGSISLTDEELLPEVERVLRFYEYME